ncbi:MAG TPA: hypothetical protein VHK91_10150 [Flavisolibacter sp.]|jgi:hypothetical protein|nr:hypothetical protein [Flavisolibacter sp.]
MNKTVIIVYVLIVAVAFYVKRNSQEGPPALLEWQAARALLAGQQLKRSDLRPNSHPLVAADSLVGRHLLTSKRADATITEADVSLLPQLADSAKDTLLWMLTLRPQERVWNELVGQEALVQFCATEQQEKNSVVRCVDPLPVLAIHQSSDSSQPSFWLIRLPASRAAEAAFLQAARERSITVRYTGHR